ncbi:MAG: hypothetical protein KC503_31515 [Myxococcales bacterium]|nr:hypothetical protein [Myxococcales bacterium]
MALVFALGVACAGDRTPADAAPDATVDSLLPRDTGTPAICAQLEQQYAAALLAAKACTPPPTDDAGLPLDAGSSDDASGALCLGCYAASLECPCATVIASADDAIVLPLKDLLAKFQSAGCPRRADCRQSCTIDFTWPERGCESLRAPPQIVRCSLQSPGVAICSSDVIGP